MIHYEECPFCHFKGNEENEPYLAWTSAETAGVPKGLYPKGVFYVECANCDATGPRTDSDEEATNLWNTR